MDALKNFFNNSSIDGWDITLAVISLIIGIVASRIARRATLSVLGKLGGISDELASMAARAVKYFVLFIGIGVALTFLGASIQPLVTAAIVASVIAALTLRGVADNFGASVVLQTRRPFHVGDEIEGLDHVGIVKELNGRAVVIETFDGRTVHLPNAELLDSPIINHTVGGARRSEVEVRTAEVDSLDAIRNAVSTALAAVPSVLADPPPRVATRSIEPERAVLRAYFWHAPSDGLTASSEVVESVGSALAASGWTAAVITPPPPVAAAPPPGSL